MTQDETTGIAQDAFVERVMAAIVVEPQPTPTRTFATAIRRRSGRHAMAALSVAWHLGTERSWHIAPRVRARSMALVLAVVAVLGTGSLAAAAAIRTVAPQIVLAPGAKPIESMTQGQRPDPDEPLDVQPGPSLDTTIGTGTVELAKPDDTDPRPTPKPPAPKATGVDAGSAGTRTRDDHEDRGSASGEQPDAPDDNGSGHERDSEGSGGRHQPAEPGDGDHAGATQRPGGDGHDDGGSGD